MKRIILYVLLGVLLVAVLVLLFSNIQERQRFDQRITLRKSDKIPYGSFVAHELLPGIFPQATVINNRSTIEYLDWRMDSAERQLLMIVSPQFLPDETELFSLVEFAHAGHDVFISTRRLSSYVIDHFKLKSSFSFESLDLEDSLKLTLDKPMFRETVQAVYPGKKFDNYLYQVDTAVTQVLATDEQGDAVFIRLSAGTGNIYLHMAPLAFSNYFILHKNNYRYYQQALSVIDPVIKTVIWDEYFLNKTRITYEPEEEKGWLSVLFQYPGFKAGLITAILAGLLFVLMHSRRKQRLIPVSAPLQNESLEFIKTIGRLYHEKGDHKNLAQKKAQYFLDHVRTYFYIQPHLPEAEFIQALHQKTGYTEKELSQITGFIHFLEQAPAISQDQLATFYHQLEKFYKNT